MSNESKRVHLEVDGAGMGTLTVDGHSLGNAVQATSIHSRAGHATRVELELLATDVSTQCEPEQILIPEETREALIALGWTPPQETEPGRCGAEAPTGDLTCQRPAGHDGWHRDNGGEWMSSGERDQ